MTKVLMCVAHPDDEILWGGGLPIRYPELDWRCVCCSYPSADPIRAYQFFDVCEALGMKGRIYPRPDGLGALESLNAWLDVSEYDHVVTHGPKGEYGHAHHIEVHEYIKSCNPKKLTTFGFGTGVHRLELSADERAKKLAAFKKYSYLRKYGSRTVPAWQALIGIHHGRSGSQAKFEIETYNGDWF